MRGRPPERLERNPMNGIPQQARTCLRPPIPQIEQAATCLDAAATAHLEGRRARAAQLINEANMDAVRDWTESLWGRKSRYAPSGPLPPFIGRQAEGRMPGLQLQCELHDRDGFYCRFCGIPVIRKQVRERLRMLYPDLRIWGRANRDQHAALQCMWAQYDHLLPYSRGGENELGNLVVTCAPCNYGRMQYTLEEANLENPLHRLPRLGPWEGLEELLRSGARKQ